MNSVPTLCATATVALAPLGLALGTPIDHRPNPSSLQQPHPHKTPNQSSLTALHRSGTPTTSSRLMSYFAHSHATPSPSPSTASVPTPSSGSPTLSRIPTLERLKTRRKSSTIFSRDATSSPSERGLERSNTYSSSSTQPFITPRAVSTPHTPNKLVKRSLSQHLPKSSLGTQVPKTPILKRPVTSHQRSATWTQNRLLSEESHIQQAPHTVPKQKPSVPDLVLAKYRHVFTVRRKRSNSKYLNGRKVLDAESTSVQHIQPDGCIPVLLLASKVTPANIEVDDVVESESDSPWTSKGNTPTKLSFQGSPTPRRSLSRFLRDSPDQKEHSPKGSLRSRLPGRLGKRIISAPTPSKTHFESEPVDDYNPKAKRLKMSPKDSRTSSSQAGKSSPLVPWDDPPLRNPSSRRRQDSAATSDFNSSRAASEGAPRIFSWAEGNDTDARSDTIYDSTRTGRTDSSYHHHGPRLETLFDDNSRTSDALGMQTSADGQYRAPSSAVGFASKEETTEAGSDIMQQTHNPTSKNQRWDDGSIQGSPHDMSPSPHSRLNGTTIGDFKQSPASRDLGLKNSAFDWSEPPSQDHNLDAETPPRPRTVHGKKAAEPRGNLSGQRRGPSGLHTRSRSVPLLQSLTDERKAVAEKYATWNSKTKRATEDWDDDFDFGDDDDFTDEDLPSMNEADAKLTSAFLIPENIQRQQSNVLANINLLSEWGILIEELKELRVRASALDVDKDQYDSVFALVDAMIDMADQEVEDDGLAALRTPRKSINPHSDASEQWTPPTQTSEQRVDRFPSDADDSAQSSRNLNSADHTAPAVSHSSEPVTRPRHNSEAMAKSVIETLIHSRRQSSRDSHSRSSPDREKIHFTTDTLKEIVPWVRNLKHEVKDIIRTVEGLHDSPRHERTSWLGSSPSQADLSPSAGRGRRMVSEEKSEEGAEAATSGDEISLINRLRGMKVK